MSTAGQKLMTLQLFFKTAVRTFNSLLYLVARFVIFTELDIKWFREHRFHKRALWIAAHVIISLKQLNGLCQNNFIARFRIEQHY